MDLGPRASFREASDLETTRPLNGAGTIEVVGGSAARTRVGMRPGSFLPAASQVDTTTALKQCSCELRSSSVVGVDDGVLETFPVSTSWPCASKSGGAALAAICERRPPSIRAAYRLVTQHWIHWKATFV